MSALLIDEYYAPAPKKINKTKTFGANFLFFLNEL